MDQEKPHKRVVAYVAMGSNVGTQPEMLACMRNALQLLRDVPDVTVAKKSLVYHTPAWGRTDQPDFLNAVVMLRTGLLAQQLLSELKCIEQLLGRVRRERWGPREIDLDIVLFGDERVEADGLTVPHPGLLERAFVLVPLLEIAPEVELPGGRRVSDVAPEELCLLSIQEGNGMSRISEVL